MSPLERRYRRLLDLLPEQHRAARGEELLGLLLDLDDGHARPSTRQTLGVIGLAIRLHLVGLTAADPVVFSAFLVAFGTQQIANLIDAYIYMGISPTPRPDVAIVTAVLLPRTLAQLSVVVAWVLGARRTALALQVTVFVFEIAIPPLFSPYGLAAGLAAVASLPGLLQIAVLCMLAVAARRRWTKPRPRPLWLATVALALLAWAGDDLATRTHPMPPAYTGWVMAAVTATIAAILVHRRPWPAIAVSVLVGAGIGPLLPFALLHPNYWSLDGLAAVVLGTALLTGVTRSLTQRRPDQPITKASQVRAITD